LTDPSSPAGARWLALAGWIALSFVPALIGQQVSSPDWYRTLDRPAWSPPSAVFGPVWTALYAAMGVAAWLVWRERARRAVGAALTLFVLQLVPNAAWSWLFFGLNRMDLAFADIVLLWVLIVAMIAAFWSIRRLAALLLVPYLLWVTFAAALNLALWRMN
jgi:translocator protein